MPHSLSLLISAVVFFHGCSDISISFAVGHDFFQGLSWGSARVSYVTEKHSYVDQISLVHLCDPLLWSVTLGIHRQTSWFPPAPLSKSCISLAHHPCPSSGLSTSGHLCWDMILVLSAVFSRGGGDRPRGKHCLIRHLPHLSCMVLMWSIVSIIHQGGSGLLLQAQRVWGESGVQSAQGHPPRYPHPMGQGPTP